MLEILEYIISVLTSDATLNAIVPVGNILVGPVDVVTQAQSGLLMPQINLRTISEASRSVPTNTRDTHIQLDIWSRTSQLELEQIYERIITLLNYDSANQGTAHISWQRLGGAVDQYESDVRLWHRAVTFQVWSQKPY